MARPYPIYLDIVGTTCLVVGGGQVAARKVEGLLEAGARVRILSPTLLPELAERAARGEVEAVLETYHPRYLDTAWLVFAATNDRAVNHQVAADARARGRPVNVADQPEDGTFLVPATVQRGQLCISVSTGGRSPALARKLCAEIEARFGPEYSELLTLYEQMRTYVKHLTDHPERRRHALTQLAEAESELREILAVEGVESALEQARALAREALKRERS
jgi:precorrin-2 dehydrogenase/sirohydrochlorin ferrochelatase